MGVSAADALTTPAAPGRAAPAERWSGLAGEPARGRGSASADVAAFTAAAYVAQAMLFVAGIVQKGLLGPAGAGYWALMGTFIILLGIATLGVTDGAGRQVPLLRGRDDAPSAAAAADTAGSFALVAAVLSGLVVAAAALLFGASWAPEIRFGLVILGALAPLKALADSHEVLVQATRRFRAASLSTVLRAGVLLTVQTLLVMWLGFYGMFCGLALATASSLVLYQRLGLTGVARPAFRLRIDRDSLRGLLGLGVPMLLHGQVWFLFLAVDNLIVAALLGVEQLGYYALAVSVSTYIMVLPKSVGAVLAPRMAERYGRDSRTSAIESYATSVQQLLAFAVVPALVAAAFFLMPVLIRHALPDFAPSIGVVRIMVAGSFFIALTNMPIKILHTTGRNWGLAGLTLACLALNAAANWIAVGPLDGGVEAAAAATAGSYLVLLLAVTVFALHDAVPPRRLAEHLVGILAVGGYTLLALWGTLAVLGAGGGSLVADTAHALLSLAVLGVALAPLLVLAERRHRLSAIVRAALPGRLRRGA